MRRIAIATHKGGTGKTVTAINLAAGLSRNGKNTLLIDLDPQGHSTLGLGVEAKLNELTVSDILLDGRVSLDGIVRKVSEKLFLIPSNIRLAKVAESLYSAVRREERLSLSLSQVNGYDYMVIDCPPSLGTLTANALSLADFILVPCEMGARAADGLVDLLEILFLLKGCYFSSWRIVLTKFDSRKSITNEAVMESLKQYKDKILNTRIGIAESLNQAQIAGKDIFTYDSGGRGVEFYGDLTNEIISVI